MLLTIDVGNTQTLIGLYEEGAAVSRADDGLREHWRVSTVIDRTADELAGQLQSFLSLAGIGFDAIEGLAVASGVPRVKAALTELADQYLDFEPVIIGPGVKTGMPIRYDNPREVGADRIANAIGAYELFGGPTIVVDFGTGNNYDIVSADGEFIGGAIAPGIEISMDALAGRASALSSIDLVEPRSVIGKSTTEALQSGALYGFAASVDGMVRRFQDELGGDAVVVATGGLAPVMAPVTSTLDHVEPFLTLHGLRIVHMRNS
ncbi:MAG: type III pantothenate kinase [Acidimicrobiales bacterium]